MVSASVLQMAALTDPTLWITALAGGAFGAAIGALPAFIMTGFAVIAGEALGAALREETTASGRLPTNLSGGLKAKGHPVGATGVSQVAELTKLLRGDHPAAGELDGARVGLAHNAGGTVATAVVHLLEVIDHA